MGRKAATKTIQDALTLIKKPSNPSFGRVGHFEETKQYGVPAMQGHDGRGGQDRAAAGRAGANRI